MIAIFLRHGDYHQLADTPSAHQPFPLNDEGLAQVRAGARELAAMIHEQGWRLDREVHTSSLLRAWQTAELVSGDLPGNFVVKQTAELAERGLGAGANLTLEQLAAVIDADPRYPPLPPGWKSDSQYRLPLTGAESLMEAGRRVATFVKGVMAGVREGSAVLFVGHGAAFRHAAHHMGALAFGELVKLSMHHARPVALGLGADGYWSTVAGEWKIRGAEKALD